MQQSLKDLQSAYEHFFRRVQNGATPGFPRFKRKGRNDAFRYPQGVKVHHSKVFLPKIGWARYRDSRPVEGRILQATVKREGPYWFVSLACEVELPDSQPVALETTRVVGIDVGLKTFATLSDGMAIENPLFLAQALAALRQAQRSLSRKVKRSQNWYRQLRKVVTLHTRVKNARLDLLHKVSTAIIKSHDVVAVEDLNIQGMVKNHALARSIADVGWDLFVALLKYKAAWVGKRLVQIGRFEATSQACSGCGQRQPMPLSLRTYECAGCGLTIDRDWNASLNIRAAGLAVLNACGVGASRDIALVGG